MHCVSHYVDTVSDQVYAIFMTILYQIVITAFLILIIGFTLRLSKKIRSVKLCLTVNFNCFRGYTLSWL